jgi:glycosyltransferase involved in cell wall biosynthesis
MRVLLATNSRDRGSTSRTLEAWARRLPGEGVTPVVTIGGDGPLLDALGASGVETVIAPLRVFPDLRRPYPFVKRVAALSRLIIRAGVDLIHVNEHEFYPVVARAARLTRRPLVVHIRFRPDRPHCEWLFKPPYVPARVFFTSRTQMEECRDALTGIVPEARWRLLPNGIDPEVLQSGGDDRQRLRTTWGLGEGSFAVGSASSISPRKRLDHVVELVSRLRSERIDAHGFIAGIPYFDEDARELERLQDLVTSSGLQPWVRFLGYVEPVFPLYRAWDVCVTASEYESFGMTVLEAMASGCPVIGYPGGAVAEVAGDAAAIVPEGDVGALAAAARALAADPSLRRARMEAGRHRAEAFDVRACVRRLAAEYVEVVGGR